MPLEQRVVIIDFKQLVGLDLLNAIEMLAEKNSQDVKHVAEVFKTQGIMALIGGKVAPEYEGAVHNFLLGIDSEKVFILKMAAALGAPLQTRLFKECWKAMCKLQTDTGIYRSLKILRQLQQEHRFKIFVTGAADPISAANFEAFNNNPIHHLEYRHYYSFESHSLKPTTYAEIQDYPYCESFSVLDLRAAGALPGVIDSLKSELSNDVAMGISRPSLSSIPESAPGSPRTSQLRPAKFKVN